MTLDVRLNVEYHEIEGGGFWAEVTELPGCIAQAEDLATLKKNLSIAVSDWLRESSEKTEKDARELAEIQGVPFKDGESYPKPYVYREPAGWVEEDE
jgi:predicted RNase H-like HicB family nuclease